MASEALDIKRIDTRSADWVDRIDQLREKLSPRGDVVSEEGQQRTIEVFGEPLSPQQVVERICRDVRDQGVEAVLQYGRQLDGAELTAETLRVPSDMLATAHQRADAEFLQAVRRIRANILEFQTALLQQDVEVRRADGTRLQQRYLPLRRVGICVPGGAAAYPSTVLMTAVLAQAAGVAEIAVVAPPTEFGANNTDVLATCHELGIDEVYRVGGAQAVSALAYGAGPITRVDKIVGPGNLFVALAKKWVYGEVDIDAIAGPSEVVVIADGSTRPDYTAADMLAQAEHAPGASLLITWDERQRDAVAAELERQVASLSRSDLTLQSLESFGALILVRDAEEACRLTNLIAPEHLHIAVDDTGPLLARIESAGAIFLGHHSPVALGDYVAGPSHVLPTGGTARWAAGLTANDFLRGGSIIEYSSTGLAEIAEDVRLMADKEGLTAHRGSVDIRCS
ncbi:MAG: histidinol dehydrogenase [Pirellulales bacterium]|nr:histidinol dehydrogenase [Pirellulales bacterium]